MLIVLANTLNRIRYNDFIINIVSLQEVQEFNQFRGHTHLPSLLLGIFFGLMLVMALYNLLLYFTLKDKAYLLYVGTTIFSILTAVSTNGLGDQFFWPNSQGLDASIYITFAGISMFFSSRFAAEFLQLKKYSHRMDQFMWGIALLSLLLSILSIFLNVTQITPFGRWLVLCSFPSYIIIAIIVLRKGFKPAKFYLIAWIPYVLGLVTRTMHGAGWLPSNQLVLSSLELGGALEVVLLSFALAYRIKGIQEENTLIRNQLKEYISQVLILEAKMQSAPSKEENILENKIESIADKHELTARETDVFLYLAKGVSNKKIADELFVSINTVKFHTRNIYEKLDIKKRNEINTRILFSK